MDNSGFDCPYSSHGGTYCVAVMSIRKNNRYNRRLAQRERRHREEGIESADTQHSGRESGNGYNKGMNDEVPKRKKH